MASRGFSKNSGPGGPPTQNPLINFPHTPSPTPQFPAPTLHPSPTRTSESSPKWSEGHKSLIPEQNTQIYHRPFSITTSIPVHNSGTGLQPRNAQVQDVKGTISPPLAYNIQEPLRNSRTATTSHTFSQRNQSTTSIFQNNLSVNGLGDFSDAQQPSLSSPVHGGQPILSSQIFDSQSRQNSSSVAPLNMYNSGRNFQTKQADVQAPKRTRPLPSQFAREDSQEDFRFYQNESIRTSASPPMITTRLDDLPSNHSFQPRWHSTRSGHLIDSAAAATKPNNFPVYKRTRSPTLPSSDQVSNVSSHSAQDDSERELQAKAKRLLRFKNELSQSLHSSPGINQNVPGRRDDQSTLERRQFGSEPSDEVASSYNKSAMPDYEGLESSTVIIGLCPDMCPESERAERERKADLDQYERVDGDRNQTRKLLAVKKYNRTAEREADLIRPMQVLQKTMDYLLNLLDKPYDDRFLALYNFLWDRMRAIRMDLRMQHIFNLEAITMLEQMIRLHIIAMHELCEYTKGEGFSEGFDAHLNIEQMNKTSVELFQLYDDHRKKGIDVPTEKEFRGYYALLKLDKHPGYKVEPAELSLDLAKMAPEMRQTPEVLFARDVARACRTGNFIAFFRLANKASYLQACLMHAHFAKLRTQALASLHSGLLNNQGVPIAHVAKWLGMEEEDIQSLVEYHGFLIKEFEEPYIVKDGPFMNGDNDYPVSCSRLVQLKKSRRIFKDILSACPVEPFPSKEVKRLELDQVYKEATLRHPVETESSASVIDEKMPDSVAVSTLKDDMKSKPMLNPLIVDQPMGDNQHRAVVDPSVWNFSLPHVSPKSLQAKHVAARRPKFDTHFRNSLEKNVVPEKIMPLQIVPESFGQEKLPVLPLNIAIVDLAPHPMLVHDMEDEPTHMRQELESDEENDDYHDKEVAEAKLKLILRIWRRRAARTRELREQRTLEANVALSLLSMGPPVHQYKDQPSAFDEFNVDHVLSERYQKCEKSWSRLNVSEVVAAKLSVRNPAAGCLCWKIVLCSEMDNPDGNKPGKRSQVSCMAMGPWLISKLMPTQKSSDDDLVVSYPGLSIWRKWVSSQSDGHSTCCLSVIKDTKFDNVKNTLAGASGLVFLLSEGIQMDLQKIQLHNFLMSLPGNSRLPLLILGGLDEEYSDPYTIAKELGLYEIDNSRVSNHLVVFLGRKQQEHLNNFFSDEKLREGLLWLASESPLQPLLLSVKIRELVLAQLNSSLEVLDDLNACQVTPDHCIAAFNEALDQSMQVVAASADKNPAGWPCPEIALLEESSDERRVVEWYLPTVGWSEDAKIKPLMSTLRDCKLPSFPDDMSWLSCGSEMGKDIRSQKLQIENCLIKYLTERSQLMSLPIATQEASALLQKCSLLRLSNSTYYLVPNWVMIFRRVFNWRLMSLSKGPCSKAYVLEQHNVAIPFSGEMDRLGLDGLTSSPPYLDYPSLDEMVEVGCGPLLSETWHAEHKASQHPAGSVSEDDEVQKANKSNYMEEKRNFVDLGTVVETNNDLITPRLHNSSSSFVTAVATKETERLSKLLEQCDRVQDMIDKNLSIYF